MPKKKQMVAKEDWSEALHIALRKCCDSTAASLAWNIIYLLEPGYWEEYVDMVRGTVLADKSEDPLWKKLKKASLKWRPYGKGHAAVSLHCAFELFSYEDWHGYTEFLMQ